VVEIAGFVALPVVVGTVIFHTGRFLFEVEESKAVRRAMMLKEMREAKEAEIRDLIKKRSDQIKNSS
jgi:hypothetical protein